MKNDIFAGLVAKLEIRNARQLKMRHLSAFVEAVRLGSLKAAAEQIGLTQPAISKTLKDLETILGVALLHRDRGGIALTREGAIFRQFAEQSLAALSHGVASLDAMSQGSAVPLRIGALPSVAAALLPDAVMHFADLSPTTPVMIEDGPIRTIVEKLRAGDLDLVIGRLGSPALMSGLSFTPLYSEQVVFAVATDHPQAAQTDLAALSSCQILYPPKDAAIRPLVDNYMIARGMPDWPHRIETVSDAFGRAMTLGSAQAVWVISRGVVSRDIAAGRMVCLPIDTQTMNGPIGIMARSEDDPTPAIRLFRQALLAAN